MFEGFMYVSQYGILKKNDYKKYHRSDTDCQIRLEEILKKRHIFDIGYMEHDGRTNGELQ